jgi:cytochrome c oxidase subunit 4
MSAPPKNSASAPLLVGIYAALLGLLALTALATRLPAGAFNLPLALLIAFAKTALIFLFFMQLRWRRGLVRVFAVAGFFWLAIIFVLTAADYFTRAWMF